VDCLLLFPQTFGLGAPRRSLKLHVFSFWVLSGQSSFWRVLLWLLPCFTLESLRGESSIVEAFGVDIFWCHVLIREGMNKKELLTFELLESLDLKYGERVRTE
jgi:hypothetical protein